jgi:leucyl aminopeptidase (aminopeptidase T)
VGVLIPMRDPRIDNLARILVRYSVKLKEGDTCAIRGQTAGEPLIAAVYEEALRAGANPTVALSFNGQSASYFRNASDSQLDWVSPMRRNATRTSSSARIRTRVSSPRCRRSARPGGGPQPGS